MSKSRDGKGPAKRKATGAKRTSASASAGLKPKGKAAGKTTKKPMGGRRSLDELPKNENGVVLLSGGNPQIAKGYGDGPVQAYIAAMPDWKRDIGRRLDAIIEKTVPGVRKAVKWNTPFYGVADESRGWFVAYHCFNKYVKVTFFRGTSLRPEPPGASKQKDVRYLDIYEGELDEKQFAEWVKQASELPGEKL